MAKKIGGCGVWGVKCEEWEWRVVCCAAKKIGEGLGCAKWKWGGVGYGV